MDTFPSLVIYTGLLALAQRPDLWRLLNTGENVLFSSGDFTHPGATRTWAMLDEIADPLVAHIVARLQSCCAPDWRADSSLEALLGPERIEGGATAQTLPLPVFQLPQNGLQEQWWNDLRPAAPGTKSAPEPEDYGPSFPRCYDVGPANGRVAGGQQTRRAPRRDWFGRRPKGQRGAGSPPYCSGHLLLSGHRRLDWRRRRRWLRHRGDLRPNHVLSRALASAPRALTVGSPADVSAKASPSAHADDRIDTGASDWCRYRARRRRPRPGRGPDLAQISAHLRAR